jgi:hypothetical protein
MISLGPLLGVLGIKLLVVQDDEAVERYSGKLNKRTENCVHNGAAIEFKFARRYMRKLGQKGAEARWEAHRKRIQMNKKISEMKRKAVMMRWAKVKVKAKAKAVKAEAA